MIQTSNQNNHQARECVKHK